MWSWQQRPHTPLCGVVYFPLIVPPTFYKDLSNVFPSPIWNLADSSLRQANHIIFYGRSFLDAGIHIHYLLKRTPTNRVWPLRITVTNQHLRKVLEVAMQEKQRSSDLWRAS